MADEHVVLSAQLQCSMGMSPAVLTVTSNTRVTINHKPAATIMDFQPMSNIASFGMCMSLANPTVATATTAALGTLTPMPCVPVTTAPWAPPATRTFVMPSKFPALLKSATCQCMWAGTITITQSGQGAPKVKDT